MKFIKLLVKNIIKGFALYGGTLSVLICVDVNAKEKPKRDGYIYHETCKFTLKADPLSQHKHESKRVPGLYIPGYCVANM